MPNPWDPPPLPTRGDEADEMTYAGVGRVISRWEAFEFALSRLYTVFAGEKDSKRSMDQYGEGNIFRLRLEALQRKADAFFIKHCDQEAEGLFDGLATHARGFADRRNEVAHGIVFGIHALSHFRDSMTPGERGRHHFAVIPPLHTVRFFTNGWSHKPKFAYTSIELRHLDQALIEMLLGVDAFMGGVVALAEGRPRVSL